MHAVLLDTEYAAERFAFAGEAPPCLLPVVGRTLLSRTAEWLRDGGIAKVALVTRRDLIEQQDLVDVAQEAGVQLVESVAAAMRASGADRRPQEVLVMPGNLHPLPNLRRLRDAWDHASVHLGYVRGTHRPGPGQYTIGGPAILLGSQTVDRLLLRKPVTRPHDLLRTVRRAGLELSALEPERAVVVIDNNYALFDANLGSLAEYRYELYGRGLRPLKPNLWAAPDAEVGDVAFDPRGGLVVVESGVRLEGRTALRGPSILGARCKVGSGSCIHRGLVLPGSELPEESFVARAIVSPRLLEQVLA